MFNIGPWGLYYKTLRIRNVPQREIFRSKLVSFIASHKYTSLDKHASLLRNQNHYESGAVFTALYFLRNI
jgi:hypothetical protein